MMKILGNLGTKEIWKKIEIEAMMEILEIPEIREIIEIPEIETMRKILDSKIRDTKKT